MDWSVIISLSTFLLGKGQSCLNSRADNIINDKNTKLYTLPECKQTRDQ